jgi:hypothetical protein
MAARPRMQATLGRSGQLASVSTRQAGLYCGVVHVKVSMFSIHTATHRSKRDDIPAAAGNTTLKAELGVVDDGNLSVFRISSRHGRRP